MSQSKFVTCSNSNECNSSNDNSSNVKSNSVNFEFVAIVVLESLKASCSSASDALKRLAGGNVNIWLSKHISPWSWVPVINCHQLHQQMTPQTACTSLQSRVVPAGSLSSWPSVLNPSYFFSNSRIFAPVGFPSCYEQEQIMDARYDGKLVPWQLS